MGLFSDSRWQLVVTRLGILAFKIVIIVILVLALITPMTGGVKVNAPELNNAAWSFDNGTLKLGSSVGVYNGAMFDVKDFFLVLGMTDANATSLGNYTTGHTDIRSGQWSNLPLKMTIDLNKMNGTALSSFVFNQTKVNMALEIGATYPLGWVSASIGGNSSTDWPPLVSDYGIDTSHARVSQSGGQYTMTIPYHVSVSSMVSGAPMDLKVTMSNNSGVMATSDQQIVLRPQNNGNIVLNLTSQTGQYLATHSDQLHFKVQAGFMSASVYKTVDYQWSPVL
ncbi:MAG TPA: hypothetical protein VGK23_06140 [Methanomassiliicoccales archaeon]|jgi:hypothetical protein